MTTVVPFKARGLRAVLREALDQRTPMRFMRERIHPGLLHGFVIGLSRDYCLIAEVGDAMRFDGYVAVAIADLSLVEADPSTEFVIKALALREEHLEIPREFDLSDWASIAKSAAQLAPLMSINMIEDEDGEVSYVGQLADIAGEGIILRELDPNAAWYPDTGGYEFEAIGSIGFGNGYLEALWQVAGSPADPMAPRAPLSDSIH